MLPAGGTYSVGTKATSQAADLLLDVKRLWHKSKLDTAIVYDASGAIVTFTDNGMAE
ncbi:MAG: hypothetical protein IJS53_02130 [Clostridia bacterium]|nr:hypothetical protein [Clostridia bacterium]